MGGGGGAGHQNEGVGSAGMAGGGILVIIADHLAGNGHQIESNGGNALESGVDGAGGGGSGGTIVMDVGSLTGAVSIHTNGGHGGNNKGVPWMNHCIAPGGGGSGGVLYITKSMLPLTVFFDASGGNAGQILSPSSNCYLTSYGAESGKPGFWSSIVELTVGSEENTAPVLDVNISNDSICLGDSVILKGIGNGNLVWTNGVENGVPFFPPLGNSGYTLTLTDPYGCSTTEHVQLFVSEIPDLNDVPGYYDICQKSEVQIDVGNVYKYTEYFRFHLENQC
ncbi:MAG: hypothetical protein IPJ06_08415 [Saprospiraceae bacterium]|nr:hypothetical protein [Saprospiraceae bacterium]